MTKTPDFTHATYKLVRCIGCDATVSVCRPQAGEYAQCPRCHQKLQSGSRWSLKRCSLIALSILILMPFALGYPLLSLDLLGTKIDASVWQRYLENGGKWLCLYCIYDFYLCDFNACLFCDFSHYVAAF